MWPGFIGGKEDTAALLALGTKLLLSFTVNNSTCISESVNSVLKRIRKWCFDNCLMLNPDKTKLMVLAAKECLRNYWTTNYPYYYYLAQSVKDLGVIFDPMLSFDNHISTVVSSCMSKLSQISRITFVFNKQLLETIINALVFSKLYYCSSIWSSTSACNICKLQYV